jgi:hypothetical protein
LNDTVHASHAESVRFGLALNPIADRGDLRRRAVDSFAREAGAVRHASRASVLPRLVQVRSSAAPLLIRRTRLSQSLSRVSFDRPSLTDATPPPPKSRLLATIGAELVLQKSIGGKCGAANQAAKCGDLCLS